jgi:tRNA A-37 threonylcarbamoyl transferase component Bud32
MDLQIPGYKIVRPIAEGGMACVYLAIQESLQRQVALKLLRQFDDPVHASRFRNEGRIIASLNHRNIITIHDIGVIGERHYLAMEYLEDGDLERQIKAGMGPDTALEVVEVIGSSLDFLHRRGIIHRDIKPANILFRKDGTPVLTDFGIAKQLDQDMRLTLDSTALGSPCYLSPEQAECKPLDGRTDIYGLGIILYEMLTGRKPFRGDSPIETILAHLTAPCPSLPAELSSYQGLLDRMVAKAPNARYATAGEMVTAIRQLRKRRQGNMRSLVLSGAICHLRDSRILAQVRRLGLRANHLIQAGLKQVWLIRPLAAGRGVHRKLGENLPRDTRLRRAATLFTAVLLFCLAAGGFLMKPTVKATKAQAEQAPAVQATTHPVVLRLSDDLAIQRENDLQLARRALEDYRLTTPDGDNAWYYYRRVLEEDPDNTEALTGVKGIADTYGNLARRELDQFHYRKARSYLERGLMVDPGNERLLKLKGTSAFSYTATRTMERMRSLFR